MKFTYRKIKVGALTLRVAQAGNNGNKASALPPLLLLNGIGFNAELMEPLARALATDENGESNGRAIVIPDMPGCGGSPDPAGNWLMYRLSGAISEMMAQLHPGRSFDCLGFSWGGALAQQIAVQASRRVERLMLISTTCGLPVAPANPDVVKRLFDPEEYVDPRRLTSNFIALLEESGAGAGLMKRFRSPTPAGVGNQLLALTGWSVAPMLPFVRVPTLLVGVVDDAVVPFAHHHMLTCLMPHASVLNVGSGGHLTSLASPEKIAPDMRRFLAGESVARGRA